MENLSIDARQKIMKIFEEEESKNRQRQQHQNQHNNFTYLPEEVNICYNYLLFPLLFQS
jgi:hypothetical protein